MSKTDTQSLQEFADAVVAPEFRQPLKTVREACAAVGWEFQDHPVCCGAEIDTRSMFGDAYVGECKTCGRFIADVTGPQFSQSGSSVSFIDRDQFPADTDWGTSWIAGQRAAERPEGPS
jgi:hypothetical protein